MSGLQLLGSRYQKFLSDVPCDVYSWIVVVISFFFAAYFATLWWIKMNIKFDDSSFSRSRDMVAVVPTKIQMVHVTWPRPFQGCFVKIFPRFLESEK